MSPPSSSERATSLSPGPRLSLGLCEGRGPRPAAHILPDQSWASMAEVRGRHQLRRVAGPAVPGCFSLHTECAGTGRQRVWPSRVTCSSRLSSKAVPPFRSPEGPVVRIEPGGADVVLCSVRVWGHGGPGPHLLLSASCRSGQQRAPRGNGGRGCGCALGLLRSSVLEPQNGRPCLISLAPELWSRALMPPAALAT